MAAFLFETEDALIRIDMSEYMERFAVSRLVGAPPGYVGYDEGGQLTEAVQAQPYSVILLDEIEKAHPEVFNILLQVMEDGRLTDSQGRIVDFKNTVIIMTSNIGAQSIQSGAGHRLPRLARRTRDRQAYESMKNRIMDEMKRTFRPEFLNRVDEIIVFHQLTRDEILQIVDLMLDRVRQQVAGQGMDLEVTQRSARAAGGGGLRSAVRREAAAKSGAAADRRPAGGRDAARPVLVRRHDPRRARRRQDLLHQVRGPRHAADRGAIDIENRHSCSGAIADRARMEVFNAPCENARGVIAWLSNAGPAICRQSYMAVELRVPAAHTGWFLFT